MNLKTLSNEEPKYKEGSLPVALYSNNLSSETDAVSYYAMTIIRGVCTAEDIADDLILDGLNEGLSKDQLTRLFENVKNAKFVRLSDGFAVNDGIVKAQLKVKGSFSSDSESYSPEKHSIDISVTPVAKAKKLFSNVVPVIRQGNSRKPVITSVVDSKSKSSGTLTKGGFVEIKGTNIRILGTNEDVGLYFVNTEDSSKTIRLSADDLGMNNPSGIVCAVPLELSSGSYKIKIVTQYSNGTVPRKNSLSAVYGSFSVA